MPTMFPLTLDISFDKLCGALCAAREGGSNYWLKKIEVQEPRKKPPRIYINGAEGSQWLSLYVIPLVEGGSWVCTPEDDKPRTLDKNAITRGLKIMQEKYPRQFGLLLGDGGDASTGDVFLQCCLFGECVYG